MEYATATKEKVNKMANDFLDSPGKKEWRLWQMPDGPKIDFEVCATIQAAIPVLGLPPLVEEAAFLKLFEINNESAFKWRNAVQPALELRYQNSYIPSRTYIGLIEGLNNVTAFLKEIIRRSNIGSLEQ